MRTEIARSKTPLSRRFLLTFLVRLPLVAGLLVASSRLLFARRQPRFDPDVERAIAAVVDHMLPGDGLPGALALGIDRRIAASTDSELLRSLAQGAAWLDGRARAAGASRFIALDAAGREAVLQAALSSDAEGADAIVRTLRNRALTLYYTEPAIMSAFAYTAPPQPEGFPDFQDPPR